MGKASQSAINSLKEIVTIVTGVTVTNAIVVFLTDGDYTKVKSLEGFALEAITLFSILIANIIRFYHGNIRHLDTAYFTELGNNSFGDIKQAGSRKTAVDFFVVFTESLVFAALSFYLVRPIGFFVIYYSLLAVDIIWFLSTWSYTTSPKVFWYKKVWIINNVVTFVVFCITVAWVGLDKIREGYCPFYQFSILAGINTVVDFVICWPQYFPSSTLQDASPPERQNKKKVRKS